MAEAGLRTDNTISWLKTCEVELSQHPERAAPMEGLMSAPLARAQGEVNSKRLCSVCNRLSTCTYYNSEHASSCLEIHFSSFVVVVQWNSWPCCLAKLLLVILLRERTRAGECTQASNLDSMLHVALWSSMFCRFRGIQRICQHAFFWNWHMCMPDEMVFTCWSS